MFILFLVLILNFVISWFNANQVGRYWTEKSQLPTWTRIMMWCGAIMSVCGFFVVYVEVLTMVMHDLHLFEVLSITFFKVEMTSETADLIVNNIFNFAYLAVIFPVLGTGLAIWGNSIAVAIVRRDWVSAGIAGWNTFAQVHNTINAVKYVPRATKDLGSGIGKLFKGKKSGQLLAYILIFLLPIVVSLGGAIATTMVIMKASDEKYQLEEVAA